jgi:excisionase family DNA binding protein
MNSLLTTKEVAESLSIHPKTVYKLVKDKRIPFIKREGLGIKFRKKDVEDWLNKGANKTIQMVEFFPKFEPKIEIYDKILMKGRSALNKKSKRWNYGIGAVYARKTKQGKDRWYIDYRNEEGKRIQKVVKNAQSREEATLALQKAVLDVFCSSKSSS